MRRPRTVMIVAAAAAMVMTSIATPVAALPDPLMVFVHGLPGVGRVDVCVNGKEVKSRLKYGKIVKTTMPVAMDKIVAKKAAPGKCKGKTIAKIKRVFKFGSNDTIALSRVKGGKGFHVWSNVFLPCDATAEPTASVLLRNATKRSPLDIYVTGFPEIAGGGPDVSLPTGQQWHGHLPVGYYSVWASKGGEVKPLIGPSTKAVDIGKIRQFIFIGTRPRNYAVVSFQIADPSI